MQHKPHYLLNFNQKQLTQLQLLFFLLIIKCAGNVAEPTAQLRLVDKTRRTPWACQQPSGRNVSRLEARKAELAATAAARSDVL
jgi:hypothetical protein